MKRIKLLLPLLVLILSLSFSFLVKKSVDASTVVAAPTTDEGKVDRSLENIYIRSTAIASFPVTYKSGFGATITWKSTINEEIDNTVIDASKVNETGGWVIVHRSATETKTADLTVTVSLNDVTKSKTVTVTVPKGTTVTNTYNVAYDFGELTDVENQANPKQHTAGNLVELQAPTKTGYQFVGWYTDAAYTNKITYLPVGAYKDITVYGKFAEVTLVSIAVTGEFKKAYTALETFDKTGMVVTATYSDGSTKDVTASAVVSEEPLHYGNTSVLVSYRENDVTAMATIEGITVTQIQLKAPTVAEEYSFEYDGTAHSVNLKAPTNVTISYSVNNTLTNVGSNTVEITFEVPGIDYTIDNTTATTTLKVTPRPITVKANDYDKTYGDAIPETFEWTVTSGEIVANETLEFTCAKPAGTNVGTYPITITKNDEYPNYNITLENGAYRINQAPLTVTPKPVTINRGASLPSTVEVTVVGLVNNNTIEDLGGPIVPNWTGIDTSTAGTKEFTISGYKNSNYKITYNVGTLTINESSVVINIPEEKLTVTYTGAAQPISSDDITFTENSQPVTITNYTVAYTLNGVTVVNPTNAGTYNVVVSFNDTNYGTGSHSFTYIINKKAVNIEIAPQTVTYNGSAQTLDQNQKIVTGLVNENDLGTITLTLASEAINAGDYPITVTYTKNANYTVTATEGAKLTITPKEVTITISNQESIYNGEEPEVNSTMHNANEVAAGVELDIALTKAPGADAGEYAITGTASNTNYKVTFVDGTFTIKQAETIIKTADVTVPYDGAQHSISATINHTESTVSYSDNNGQTNAGTYTVTITVEASKNYKAAEKTATITINKVQLTLTANDATIQKGSAFPDYGYTFTGFVNGETETALPNKQMTIKAVDSEGSDLANTDTIGTYTIAISCTFDACNYELTNAVSGTLTIEMTNTEKATADANKINADLGGVLTGTVYDIPVLPLTGENGSIIEWEVKSPDTVEIDRSTGEVIIHSVGNAQIEISLQATVKNGNNADPDGLAYTMPFTFIYDFTPKGTIAENPYSANEAIAIANALNENAFSDEAYYVSGVIVTEPIFDSSHNSYRFDITDSSTNEQTRASNVFTIYGATLGKDVKVPTIGMTVVVYGYFKNHNGNTPELAGNNTHTYPSIVSPVMTAQEKLELDVPTISLPKTLSANTTFPVTLTYGSTVVYTSSNTNVLSIAEDGTVTVYPGETDVTVNVSYVVSNGIEKSEGHNADIVVKAKGATVTIGENLKYELTKENYTSIISESSTPLLLSKTPTYKSFDATKGVQLGSSKNPMDTFTIAEKTYDQGVSKIVINASVGSSGNTTISIKVGDTVLVYKISETQTSETLTLNNATTPTEYEFVVPNGAIVTGDIVISVNASAKAFYIKTLEINPLAN